MIASLFLALASVGAPERFLEPVPIERVKLSHEFFVKRLQQNTRVTIPHCLKECADTGRIANFAIAAGTAKGERKGLLFDDSDVYKTIEAIGWTLVSVKVPELEAQADAIIDSIVAAQKPDGYLNTYVQLTPGKAPWQDLKDGHELYCGGHLIEAGIAYARGTGKTKLLDAAVRFANLVDRTFGPGKNPNVCGHPEIELALAKLHEHTGEPRWLELARFFLDARGNPARKERFGEYAQDDKPIREQMSIVGHAVRAGYLYTGAADVAMLAPDATLVEPLKALWADAWDTKTYITGGIGSSAKNEGITKSFDLPNATAYCETCAGIALAMWSQRMLILTGEAKYADAVERILYNHAAAATNLAGDKFFYAQPLESDGTHRRQPWYECACCPPNIARFWPQVPGMIFAQKGNTLYQTQLASAEVDVELAGSKVQVRMLSDLPNSGRQTATIVADKPATWTIKLRKPNWNVDAKVKHDMKEQEHDLYDSEHGSGWVPFERGYEVTDGFMIHFLAPVRRVKADERVEADRGRVALMRGPLVYCLEGVDNGGAARSVVLTPETEIKVENVGTILDGTRVIRARAKRVVAGPDGAPTTKVATMTAIPYYLWDNREAGDMTVWIAESPEKARVPQ
ncbi:MAG: glycoside hydrolase family 127 protein [Planctomycetota bacterium]|nr:glycoside hydrolase family 127 protein [Planctomycetota bacterium]